MVTATVLEQVVQALVRGERVAAVARAYGVHLATCPGSAIPRSSARTSSAARSQHCEAERTPVSAGLAPPKTVTQLTEPSAEVTAAMGSRPNEMAASNRSRSASSTAKRSLTGSGRTPARWPIAFTVRATAGLPPMNSPGATPGACASVPSPANQVSKATSLVRRQGRSPAYGSP